MKIFFIIFSLLTAAVAQDPFLSCTYNLFHGLPYRCDLTINNPNGFNNFTEIEGIHLEDYTNADVGQVFTVSGLSVTVNIPSIVCETFPNLEIITLNNAGLTEIDDSSFRGCSRVYELALRSNRITSIASNAFVTLPDITFLYLDRNSLVTLPEDVFGAQQNLLQLDIGDNPLQNIPDGLFQPLENLRYMVISNVSITTIKNQWFASNKVLDSLYLSRNRLTLTTDSFVGLESLAHISLVSNGLGKEIPVEVLAKLPNLQTLDLSDNNITELRTDSFSDLASLVSLVIDNNPIQIIREGAFRGNLSTLSMRSCRLRQIEPHSFEGLDHLKRLLLDFNEIEQLPQGVFASLSNIEHIVLSNNRLKILHRNSFGELTRLRSLQLNRNIVNALDRAIIDDAVNFSEIYLTGNVCVNGYFGNFEYERARHLPMLEGCFRNVQYFVDTVTEGDDDPSFFGAPNPGIALRVNTTNEVQIALTPTNFMSNPVIEIIIASTNNTRSIIRMNQETNFVNASTPNIIERNQWNDFRISWVNNFIQVFIGNNTLPFMGFYLPNLFPVNFYGLRSVETSASWSVQPI